LVYGQFYESTDYVFGFLPFWPLTEEWIEAPPGAGGMPVSFRQLQLVWLVFTATTWGITILACRFILYRLPVIFAAAAQADPETSGTEA
jgi:hypothetical protein